MLARRTHSLSGSAAAVPKRVLLSADTVGLAPAERPALTAWRRCCDSPIAGRPPLLQNVGRPAAAALGLPSGHWPKAAPIVLAYAPQVSTLAGPGSGPAVALCGCMGMRRLSTSAGGTWAASCRYSVASSSSPPNSAMAALRSRMPGAAAVVCCLEPAAVDGFFRDRPPCKSRLSLSLTQSRWAWPGGRPSPPAACLAVAAKDVGRRMARIGSGVGPEPAPDVSSRRVAIHPRHLDVPSARRQGDPQACFRSSVDRTAGPSEATLTSALRRHQQRSLVRDPLVQLVVSGPAAGAVPPGDGPTLSSIAARCIGQRTCRMRA